ncbi:MAG TPA: GAF domain-containing protein [Solirubrobacteraceae bacterium]|nr:GAF domain-containing protein [Solirubrobacteraceae bacterium]
MTERETTEMRFGELLESAPDAVVLVDAQGQIKLVNRRTEQLFGYEPGELIDREVDLLVPDRFRTGHLAHRAGYVADPRLREMGAGLELYGRRRDGSEFPVEISLSPIRADGDRLVIAIARDVSERRAAELERMKLGLEQAALRRVATLVARGVPAEELFAAVTEEVARLLHVDHAHLGRYESDGTVTILADSSGAGDPFPVGGRWSLVGENLSRTVAQTGRTARIDDYSGASGPLAVASAERGIHSAVGTPIVVEGRLWGVMIVGSMKEQPLPADTEMRLAAFTELVATAIANAESRAGVNRLAEEQAALRRVATLVARGVPAHEVFDAVANETKRILEFDTATLLRLEPDGFITTAASVATLPLLTAVGDRRTPLAGGPVDRVLRTGRPARIDGFEGEPGSPGDELNALGYGGAAAAPIFVEGRLWGVLRAAWSKERSVLLGSEDRLLQFSELIATALANAEAREELRRVAEEQAALRRVATLVARGEPPSAVFAAVAAEAGRVIQVAGVALVGRYDLDEKSIEFVGAWSPEGEPSFAGSRVALAGHNVATLVFEGNEPARVDRITPDDTPATALAHNWARSSAGAPINVDGRLWGVITVGATHEDELPPGTEHRLAQFTELVASAISNAQARGDLGRVADEQAALRRVATLVAEAVPPADVFAAVAEEIGRLLAVDDAAVWRYLQDGSGEILSAWSQTGEGIPVGFRAEPVKGTLTGTVRDTRRPARVDRYTDEAGGAAREIGIRSSVGAPIIVEGELWGLIAVVSTSEEPPPPGTEERLAVFTELVATAIANAQAREELRTIADEQAALRRVATLVAAGAPPAEVFATVAEEIGRLLAVDAAAVRRYMPDGTAEILAQWSQRSEVIPVGPRAQPVRGTVTATVRETRRPARVDRYTDDAGAAAREIGIRSAVGVPITVEGELWGLIAVVSTSEEPPPPGTEERLAGFTELVGAAIANAQAREELRTIADEQAAVGRVATLVAQGEAPAVVFDAVAEQVGHLLNTDDAVVVRFEPDESVTIVASWTATGEPLPVGHRRHVEPGHGLTPLVRETGRPQRIDSQTGYRSQLGLESAVAAPITVEGRIWGVVAVALRGHELAPPETEQRLVAFTGLVATAIANADNRAELTASRARIVTAADEERGRVVRDLHDGAQQHLVHAVVTLKLARGALTKSDPDAGKLLDDALQQAEDANLELRELAHGILPAALRRGGLRAGVEAVISRMSLPVSVDMTDERFPAGIESTAYFVVSESLTNVVKHANANRAEVTARVERGVLRVEIVDDGIGGLRRTGISGLSGLEDRVSALEGSFLVESPLGQGTRVRALLPLPDMD